ncbi:MAG TPA: hypothetical protein ENH87_09765 [Pricia antarctica]|uniref:Uncharacterized protein n=1 Tax=Pricia antarctica TaxID=641691 RepID=A0A831QQL7_9FLAO|nr:hypothetical protein [Pricia antarctica]
MRRILFWGTSILIGIYIAGGMPAWGQALKPLTPEQQIENLVQEKAQAEFNYHSASIKALIAEDNLRMLQKKYDLLLIRSQRLAAEKMVLMSELKTANAKVAQQQQLPLRNK